MSRYEKASHVYWRCQYHIVWTPKYRFRILKNKIGKDVYRCIHVYSEQLGCKVVELNVQVDHVHLVINKGSAEVIDIKADGSTKRQNSTKTI